MKPITTHFFTAIATAITTTLIYNYDEKPTNFLQDNQTGFDYVSSQQIENISPIILVEDEDTLRVSSDNTNTPQFPSEDITNIQAPSADKLNFDCAKYEMSKDSPDPVAARQYTDKISDLTGNPDYLFFAARLEQPADVEYYRRAQTDLAGNAPLTAAKDIQNIRHPDHFPEMARLQKQINVTLSKAIEEVLQQHDFRTARELAAYLQEDALPLPQQDKTSTTLQESPQRLNSSEGRSVSMSVPAL